MVFTKEDYQKAVIYFPFVGLILGLILALLVLWGRLLLQPFTIAVLILFSEVLLTGGLHLDGFMDSCDALFSGRERERKLEIMKDSRVGAMGVIGLACLFLLKLSFLLELPEGILLKALIVMPMVGRWAIVYAVIFFPYARKKGLGSSFHSTKSSYFICSSLFCLIVFLLIVPLGKLYLALPLVAFGILVITKRINTVLGGLTGDIYGMINEIGEVLFLIIFVLISKI
jgi:adenosylcobinamide-GDP ribazoletransferase